MTTQIIRQFAIVVALMQWVGHSQVESGPERLPCRDPAPVLRESTFNLSIGTAHLHEGKDCVTEPGFPCEWSVNLETAEQWGPGGQFLLVKINTAHLSGSGAWDSVFVYRCQGEHYAPVFSSRFLYGAKVELGTKSDFWLTAGVWQRNDPMCCPSSERGRHYVWRASQARFVVTESTVRKVQR